MKRKPSPPRPARRLTVFNQISLDGYIADAAGDMQWAHRGAGDPEWQAFTSGNAEGDSVLVFGRLTYDLMARFWPTPQAAKTMPEVAARMNGAEKLVFSRKLAAAAWGNTRVARRGPVAEIRRLKAEPGPPLTVLGSGTIVAQLAQAGLIDFLMAVVVPVVIGGGQTMFAGVKGRPEFKLVSTRAFPNGNVLICYGAP
jgi:dihydrofolate reductase